MTNLITNKHKGNLDSEKPSGFEKRLSARRLRRAARVDSGLPEGIRGSRRIKYAMRKRSGTCPICLGHLQRNARGTRYYRSCSHCLAHYDPTIRCIRCDTFRVWRNRHEARCKGCGNAVALPGSTD